MSQGDSRNNMSTDMTITAKMVQTQKARKEEEMRRRRRVSMEAKEITG